MRQIKKDKIRKEIKEEIRRMAPFERRRESKVLAATLQRVWNGRERPPVAAYMPITLEINIEDFFAYIWSSNQPLWLPRCCRHRRLAWHPVVSENHVKKNSMGIREPDPEKIPASPLPPGTLVIVPGLGWGESGQRLGRGGGYYDVFLEESVGRALMTVGVGFSCQKRENLPMGPRDQSVAGVLLGNQWLKWPESLKNLG